MDILRLKQQKTEQRIMRTDKTSPVYKKGKSLMYRSSKPRNMKKDKSHKRILTEEEQDIVRYVGVELIEP